MNLQLSDVLKMADFQVSGFQVILGVVAIGMVWYAIRMVKWLAASAIGLLVGVGTNIIGRFSLPYATSSLLALAGCTGVGLGLGDFTSGPPRVKHSAPLSNEDIQSIVQNKDVNIQALTAALEYTKERDKINNQNGTLVSFRSDEQPAPTTPEVRSTSRHFGWTAFCSGVGAVVLGTVIAVVHGQRQKA